MKYIEWLNIWLNNYIKPSAKERTYIRYEQLIRTHIAPKIGDMDVNDLTPIVLQSFVTELLNNGNLKTGKALSANFVKDGYIHYSELIENGTFSRCRKRICGKQNKTPQDKGKASRMFFLSGAEEN